MAAVTAKTSHSVHSLLSFSLFFFFSSPDPWQLGHSLG